MKCLYIYFLKHTFNITCKYSHSLLMLVFVFSFVKKLELLRLPFRTIGGFCVYFSCIRVLNTRIT